MSTIRNYFLLILGTIILANWAIKSLNGFFRGGFMSPGYPGPQLAEINFDFFSEKIKKNYISQGYGPTYFALFGYTGRWHNGIDIVAPVGTPLYSAAKGTVTYVGDQDKYCYRRAYGKFVAIKNDLDGKTLLYAHLAKILVGAGEKVKAGEVIGQVGRTGLATAPHLHFSIFKTSSFKLPIKNGCGPYPTGKDSNPIPYLESLKRSKKT